MCKGIHINAMKEPRTVPWGLCIGNADLIKLKTGVEPRNQDNKWRIWVSDHIESGNISITVARVAFSRDVYVLHVKPGDGGDGGHSFEAFIWEYNNNGFRIPEEQAKKQVVVLSRVLLGCDIEALPKCDKSSIWNYSAAKKEATKTEAN